MGGLSVHMQRSFVCGLRHSSAAALHTFASPLRAASSECASTEVFDMSQSIEVADTDDLLHCVASTFQSSAGKESSEMQSWKVLRQGEHGIVDSSIPDYAWKVLRKLQEIGHETYLVGGSVRDMLLKQIPKDFDVLTTAELKQIRKNFNRSMIVGRRFPVCQVHVHNKIIEVSSFSTKATVRGGPKQIRSLLHADLDKLKRSSATNRRHHARWENSLNRDFTINGLLYDPFKKTLYDYVGGIEDLYKKKVRTVVPAGDSFAEDCARILRALRIAARLGFKFSRETARAIQSRSESIRFLNEERLRMEANYMLSYGSAEASLRLLWRFGLLEILLPPQAAYFAAQGFKRLDKSSNMLLALLANLDRLLTPARPCHCLLWIKLLALHLALVDHPESPVVVSALALALRGNMNLVNAVRKSSKLHKKYGDAVQVFPEIDVECSHMTLAMIKERVLQLRDNSILALYLMNNPSYVSTAMWKYKGAPSSDLVLVTKQLLYRCQELFLLMDDDSTQIDTPIKSESKKNSMQGTEEERKRSIDNAALQQGLSSEVTFIFSHIVMSTLYPRAREREKESN